MEEAPENGKESPHSVHANGLIVEHYHMCCRIAVTCRFKVCLRSGIIFIDWHFVSSSLIKI